MARQTVRGTKYEELVLQYFRNHKIRLVPIREDRRWRENSRSLKSQDYLWLLDHGGKLVIFEIKGHEINKNGEVTIYISDDDVESLLDWMYRYESLIVGFIIVLQIKDLDKYRDSCVIFKNRGRYYIAAFIKISDFIRCATQIRSKNWKIDIDTLRRVGHPFSIQFQRHKQCKRPLKGRMSDRDIDFIINQLEIEHDLSYRRHLILLKHFADLETAIFDSKPTDESLRYKAKIERELQLTNERVNIANKSLENPLSRPPPYSSFHYWWGGIMPKQVATEFRKLVIPNYKGKIKL